MLAVAAVAALVGLAACGSDDDDSAADGGAEMSAEAQRGAEIADDRGCGSCHEPGGLGPPWEGLYGSTVELVDGSTVVADKDYLAESITDPDAQLVDGYDIAMPPNELSDDEVASVVAYIRELGTGAPPTESGSAP